MIPRLPDASPSPIRLASQDAARRWWRMAAVGIRGDLLDDIGFATTASDRWRTVEWDQLPEGVRVEIAAAFPGSSALRATGTEPVKLAVRAERPDVSALDGAF